MGDEAAGAEPGTGVWIRGVGNVQLSVASLNLSFLGFTGVHDPCIKEVGHPCLYPFMMCPTPQLWPAAELGRKQGAGLMSRTCLCPSACPGCGRAPVSGKGRPLGWVSAWAPAPPLQAPRWGWGRRRTNLASGIKASSAVSLVPAPALCSSWVLRWGGRARTLTRG